MFFGDTVTYACARRARTRVHVLLVGIYLGAGPVGSAQEAGVDSFL